MSSPKISPSKSSESAAPWYAEGLRFQCQGSGQCCVSHGEYGFVYVTLRDRQNMARERGLSTSEFTRQFCRKEDGVFRLIDGADQACIFLKDRRCSIYAARPTQCRTWPFWPETMTAKAWKKDVSNFCPGVGKGRVWTKAEIDAQVAEQKQWEQNLIRGR
jgi:Fe-S-cluster containining protein